MRDLMGFDRRPGSDWKCSKQARKELKDEEDEETRPIREARKHNQR